MNNILRIIFLFTFLGLLGKDGLAQLESHASYLFIGDSYFSHNDVVGKFKELHKVISANDLNIDKSLKDGTGFLRHMDVNKTLLRKLEQNVYTHIIIQSPSLLKPKVEISLKKALRKLLKVAQGSPKVILVLLTECNTIPKYACVRKERQVFCNKYFDCRSLFDTVHIVSNRLQDAVVGLEILPYYLLKKLLVDNSIKLKMKDDTYGHPSCENQQLLANFLYYWLMSEDRDKVNQKLKTHLKNKCLSLSEKDVEIVLNLFQSLKTNT